MRLIAIKYFNRLTALVYIYKHVYSGHFETKVKCLRPSEAEIRTSMRAKRAWQNLMVRAVDSKRQHPSFVPQGQISQKPLRNVMPLILHTQPMGCYWSNIDLCKKNVNLSSHLKI